ncbi:hypothetical protein [Saccharomonospora cyanea]|uniref:Uncharacterized protein n=1 Tax=Saccharomonospora cyanea NA-134 TaxID=882082 RepID=H5XQD7_9PSEU|nr:hypothetical protein [Saccharomonospora cyanea]EHR63870.1 hypothetical protein SaccyDRAFT_5076 [Saccharomonospora cyanea NA-134]
MNRPAHGAGARRPASGAEPEKNTNQLRVWRDLIEALDHLDDAWQATGTSRPSASAQLPANLVVDLVRATERGTRVLAGVAGVVVQQYDSGSAFQDVASALERANRTWPTR